jgi:predicted transcriptional regulator YheO
MSDNKKKLLSYITMANYIAEMNGPRAETIIHDISDYSHSIIYITPNNITRRKVGGSLTNFAIQLLDNKTYEQCDYVVNYVGHSSINNLILRSSTYFIKDNGQLIGLLCTNIDITDQIRATELMRDALMVDLNSLNKSHVVETFSLSSDELINNIFVKAVGNKDGKNLNVDDKRKIVSELAALDVFLVKGTIQTVASLLNVSEKTIYRYINEIKK